MDTRTLLRERLRRSRDWAAAIDELEKELESSGGKPDQSEKLYELARLVEDVIPERERALALYQRAWKLHPDNLKALSRAREVYGELGRHEMVAKLGEMELKSPAAAAELAAIVGEALLDSGQREKAEQVLERALERTPDSVRVQDAVAALNYDPDEWADQVERLAEDSTRFDDATAARMLLRAARILRLEAPDDPRFEVLLRGVFEKDLHETSANAMFEALLAQASRWDDLEAHHVRRVAALGDTAARADANRMFALVWLQRFKDRERSARFAARALDAAAANGASPTRSMVAAYALVMQVQGERGDWKAVVDTADRVLDHLRGEDKLYVALHAAQVAWKQLDDVERARKLFAVAAEVEADAPGVQEFVREQGPVAVPRASGEIRVPAPATVVEDEDSGPVIELSNQPSAPTRAATIAGPAPAPEAPTVAAPAPAPAPAAPEPARAKPATAPPPPAAPEPARAKPATTPPPPAAPARVEEIPADLDAAMASAKKAESGADKGVAAWKAVVAANAQKLAPRRELARVLHGTGAWQQLADALKDEEAKAAQTPAEKALALRELADAYTKLNNENQVIAALTSSLQHEPHAAAYEQLGAIYENKKRWPDLVKVLTDKAERFVHGPDKAAVYLAIANLYLERFSNQAEAIKAFEKVLELDPNNQQAVDHLLQVYEKRRDWEKLIKLRENEIDRAPADKKAELTIDVARMAATKVKKPEVCVYWWEKVVDVDPSHDEALTELSKLYERNKEWGKLADVASKQANIAADDKTRADALQRLGLLYTEKLEDTGKAIDAWQRLLAVDENNRRAQDALKKLYVQDARWDDLEEFYRTRGKIEEYVRVLEREVEAGPEQHRLDLAGKIAVLYRDELQKADRAMRAFEKVLSLDEHNLAAAEALIPLYEAGRDPKKLVGVLEIQLRSTTDRALRRERLERLAEYNEDKLKDKGAAFGWWLKAHAEDHEAESIRVELERLAGETGAWQDLVDAYTASTPRFRDRRDALPLLSVMARALEKELGQHDRALELNRQVVDIDPSNQDALDALERLYLGKGEFQALLDIYQKKLELTTDVDERVDIQAKIGQLYEDEVKDDARAVAAYKGILDAVGDEPKALSALDRVYLRNQKWAELADVVSRQLTIIGPEDDKARHLELKFRLGQARETHLGDTVGAIDVYRDILDLDPAHAGARGRLEARLGDEAHKLTAAAILEPIYEQIGEWKQLVGVHEIQVAAEKDTFRRVGLLMRIGELERTKQNDVERAFGAFARAFKEDPSVEGAKRELEDLASLLDDGWPRLTALFEGALARDLDPHLSHELAIKVARSYEERLGKSDLAVTFYKKALDREPDDLEALGALEAIFSRDEKYVDLLDVYRRKAEIAEEPQDRLQILFRIAAIHEEMLEQPAEAIRAYQEVLAQDADSVAALRALDRLYVGSQQWQDLADNLGRQLVLVPDGPEGERERVSLLTRLAQLRETHLRELAQAIETYRQVLELDGRNPDAVSALERLLQQPAGREHELTIATILEPVYQQTGEWQKQIGVYEVMVRHAFDPVRKIELLHQIAELNELGGEDHGAAFAVHARALREDPRSESTQQQLERLARVQSRWKDLVELYDHVARDTNEEDLKVALLFKQAQIHELELRDDASAVRTYDRVLGVAPGSVEAATAIQAIHERNGDWPALVGALKRKADILLDLNERKKLLYRAAQIEEEVLGNPDAAVATFRNVLSVDDVDMPAMDALERLYLMLERWEPLKDIYAKKADLAEDPQEKTRMLSVLGQVYDQELKDVGKAIETYQAILDLDPNDDDAIGALDRLYGLGERWYDLLANLERQVELADIVGNSPLVVALKYRIGQLWQLRLGDQSRAIESYREALQMEPTHGETLAALDGLVKKKEGEPVLAARVLEPIYEANSEFAKLVEVLEVIVANTEDPHARVEIFHRMTALHEQRLDNPRAAFASLSRALRDDAGNELTLGHLERLADLTGQWGELASLYSTESEKSLDVPRQVDLLSRLARVYEEELSDVDRAIATFRRILEVEFDNKPAVLALDRLYTGTSRWKELSDVLRREIQLAEADEEVVALQFRLGQTLEQPLDDKKAAIEVYREILTGTPGHQPTLAALEMLFLDGHYQVEIGQVLEPLYETAGEFEKLHRIYEVQLGKLNSSVDRVQMHQRLAELAETRLYDLQRASSWWGAAVVEDPRSEHAVEEAERLAREAAGWDELVAVYTRALERHNDREVRRVTLLRLARVYEFELRDAHHAVETHLRVLEIEPKDGDALAALDRLYLGAGMYDELVEVLRRRIQITLDPDEQLELWFRRGAIFSDALGDLDEALACYTAVLEQESRNRRALEAQEQIYFRREAWRELFATYEKLIDVAEADPEMADTYARMARIASEALNDEAKAVDLWAKVLDIRGEDPLALGAMAELHVRRERWDDLVETLERQVAVAPTEPDQIVLFKRLGRVWAEKLGRERSALDSWLSADRLDPADLETLRALADLYRSLQSWDELSQTLRRIIEVGQEQTKLDEDQVIELYAELGRLEGDVLGRVDEAVDAWRSVLAIDASDFRAMEALEGLFTREARWEEAIEVLEKRALVLEDQPSRIENLLQAASTWEEKVEDLGRAAEVYERVRANDVTNVTASERLEAIYRTQYKWEQLAEILLERAGLRDDVQEQISLLLQVAKIYEQELNDQDNAYVILEEAFKRDFGHEAVAKELERLATATNRWQELLGEYTNQVRDLETSNRNQAADLWVKIGRWYGEHLAHIEYAIHSVSQALRIDPAHVGALAALSELQRKRGSWGELVETLSRQAASETDQVKRSEVYFNLGELLENQIMDQGQAINAYQQAMSNDPTALPVLQSLDRLYRFHQMWEPLIDVLNRRATLERTTGADEREIVRLKLEIGQIWDLRLYDAGQAIASYQSVLEIDPANLPALRALEQLYEKTGQSEKYLEVLEAQLDASPTDAERVSLYERMASAWEERFSKLDRAAEALEKIVALDARNYGSYRELARIYNQAGRWESLVETYRNHIDNTTDVGTRVDLYCAMGAVYESQLQDFDRAIESYTDVLSFDPDEPRALDALGRLYERIQEWDRAIDVMSQAVQLTEDTKKQVDLYCRIGRIQYGQVADAGGAESNFLRGLAVEQGHVATMEALTRLYSDRGDWLKAAQMMVRAEQHTPVVLDKVRLLHDAAKIYYERLREPEAAKQLYAAVIALDPEHVEAGRPLADLYFHNRDWSALSPVIEMLVRKTAQSRPDPRALNELYYRAARTADELGDYDRALRHYESAYNIDSTYLPTLIGRADLLFKMQEWDGAGKIYQTILVQHRDSQAEAEVVRIYYRLGMVRQNLGERKKALNMFEKALEIDPTHRETLEAVVALQGAQNDWEAVVHAKRGLMATANDEERVALLSEIGTIYHDKLQNSQKSIAAYLEAVEIEPEDHQLLQKVLDLYTETKQWKKVVETIERFIALEADLIRKGSYYLAAGTIARDELKASDEAMDFYNRALDSFFADPAKLPKAYMPRALKAFADIDKILTTKKDWKSQERAYRAMIKRLPQQDGGDADVYHKLRVDLLHALGEIYRSRLNHFQSAIQAFEVAQELDQNNKDRAEILAELYVRAGADYADKAIGVHMKMLRDEPFKYDSYKALYNIYKDAHQYDKTWCMCATLAFLKKADQEQLQFYEQYKPRGLVKAKSVMTPESWGKLVHPDENRYISAILGAVWTGIATFKAYPHKELNLKRKDKRQLATDQLMFSKLFYYVAQVLGVPVPEVFLIEDAKPADIQLANFQEKGDLCPAFVVRPHLLQGKTEREIAFLSARRLTFMRPEYYLKLLLPTNTELKVAFLSAIHLVRRDFPLPPDVAPMVQQQYAPQIQKHLNPAVYEQLGAVVQRFIQAAPSVDLAKWGHAVDGTSHRAGFVVCGDLEVASRMVSAEPVTVGGPQVKDKIKELVLYSISEEYFAVRQQMGIVIG